MANNGLELQAHAKDMYGNDVIEEGLEIVTAFTPAGIESYAFEELGQGAYRVSRRGLQPQSPMDNPYCSCRLTRVRQVPYNARVAGDYDLYFAVRLPGATTGVNCIGSPFSVRPSSRVVGTAFVSDSNSSMLTLLGSGQRVPGPGGSAPRSLAIPIAAC